MTKDAIRFLDWPLVSAALALSLVSVVAMASAASTLNPVLAWRQAMWVVVGIGVGVAVGIGVGVVIGVGIKVGAKVGFGRGAFVGSSE